MYCHPITRKDVTQNPCAFFQFDISGLKSSNMRILLVEDHSITRRSLRNYLLAAYPGLGIEQARNGREAIDRVAIEPPDVIIMDMVMPRLDGARATQKIKSSWPEVKILLLLLDPAQGGLALESGADAYLLKGDDPGELLRAMEDMGIAAQK